MPSVRVFKRDDADSWYLEWYVGPRGALRRRRLAAFPDRRRSDRFAGRIQELLDCREIGEQPKGELLKWLMEGVSDRTRQRLSAVDLIAPAQVLPERTLSEHIADWKAWKLLERERPSHRRPLSINSKHMQVTAVVHDCGFVRYADMASPAGAASLLEWRALMKRETNGKASHQTLNHYLAACKEFGRWMVRQRRAAEVCFADIAPLNVQDDRRVERRSLPAAEFQSLLEAAHARSEVDCRLTGPERCALWWTIGETGLRLSEIAVVTGNHFTFSENCLVVRVPGRVSKNGDPVVQPIASAGLIDMLRELLAMKIPGAPVWQVSKKTRLALKRDLEAAGIPWKDASGRQFDVHALRGQFANRLFESKTPINVIQGLMRHADIKTTMAHYARPRDDQAVQAVSSLGKVIRPAPQLPLFAESKRRGRTNPA